MTPGSTRGGLRSRAALLIIGGCVLASTAGAQDLDIPEVSYPDLPKQASSVEGFVPQGWVLEDQAFGDLDQDGAADLALVLRQNDQRNVVPDASLAKRPFDTNPRILAIAFRKGPTGDYVLRTQNHTLIPRRLNPSQEDPFDGIFIKRDGLRVTLRLFMSAGGWNMFTATHSFKYRNGRFELIGYDRFDVHRARGETSDVSVNYLTGKMKLSTGHISEDDPRTVKWKTLPRRPLLTIDAIGDGLMFDPER